MRDRVPRFRPLAASDLAEVATTLALDDPTVALRFIAAVERECAVVVAFPSLGRARAFRASALSGVRSRPISGFGSWLLFYRVLPDSIEVVRVLHGARDPSAELGRADAD